MRREKAGCPICAAMMEEVPLFPDNRHYRICGDCEYIMLLPQHYLTPAEEKARYALHNNSRDNQGYVAMFDRFIDETVNRWHDEIHSILEFGCGPGPVLAELLREQGFSVDVYDPYFFPTPVAADKRYDAITATEVFEHVGDPVRVLMQCSAHLREGGYCALMTLFHPASIPAFEKWWYRLDPTHISFYSHKTIKAIAKRCNMAIVVLEKKNIIVLQKKCNQ